MNLPLPTPSFTNTSSPQPFLASPLIGSSPILSSPYQPSFPSSNPPLSNPVDWAWTTGHGLITPPHLQSLTRQADWSVMAVKSEDSPQHRTSHPSLDPPSPSSNKKRSHAGESTALTISEDEFTKDVKRQHASPKTTTIQKRPPFPFAVPRVPRLNKPSHARVASNLNPFASEFVFRHAQPVSTLNPHVKEYSPVHLQQSSKSLFNVFAPEFNPPGNPNALSNTSLFPKVRGDAVFSKPSQTKKPIPIKKPG